MMQQDVRRARRIGARIIAHDAVEAVSGLDRRALEPGVEIIARRLHEQAEQLAPHRHVQPRDPPAQPRTAQELGKRLEPPGRRHIGRRLEHDIAEYIGDDIEAPGVGREAGRIARREFRNLRLGVAAAHLQISSVFQGQEVGDPALHHAQTVPRQFQVADHLGVEQRHRVRGDRVAEAGVELLGHRRASHHRPTLEHDHLESGRCQIGRTGEAVVAAPDDHRVGRAFSHVRASRRPSLRRPSARPLSARPTVARRATACRVALRRPRSLDSSTGAGRRRCRAH
jgi:hypothetical protein